MSRRYYGTVKWFSQGRGYGFIDGDNHRQYFVHIEAINSGDQYLDEGDRVSFYVKPPYESGQKYWRAVNVCLLEDSYHASVVSPNPEQAIITEADATAPRDDASISGIEELSAAEIDPQQDAETQLASGKRSRKRNPFDRLPTTDPSRFVGRTTEIVSATQFVSAYNSLIISGPPGVGKSSFLNQLSQIVRRNPDAVDKHQTAHLLPPERIAVARHQCEQGNNLDHIRAGLISSLRRDYSEAGARGWIKTGIDFARRTARYWTTGQPSMEPEENSEDSRGEQASQNKFYQFTEQFLANEHLLANVGTVARPFEPVGGIIFIVDEVERLDSSVNIGSFAKAAVEHFSNNKNIRTIAFVLCGAEGTATRIFAELPRARALFEHQPLPGMTEAELQDILTTNLKEVDGSIDSEAMDIIVRHANRNPARLIFLAGSCYEHDEDGIITREDCDRAARKLISNLVNADFRNVIERKSWTSTYRIMECVSDNEGTPLTAEIIASETGLELNSVESFCGILSSEGIFVSLDNKSEDRKKKYTFRDPIFALYFKLAREMGISFEKDQAPLGLEESSLLPPPDTAGESALSSVA